MAEMKRVSKSTARHYFWKEVCDGWHLVDTEGLSIIQERMPPHTKEDMHRHEKAFQFFYVLNGQATMRFEHESAILSIMDGLGLPPGAWHQMCNDSDNDVEFIVISSPKSHGDKEIKKQPVFLG